MKLFISLSCCLILLPIVCAEEINNVESHCKAGESPVYENIRTNGTQCTGFYKIITAEECKLSAEYKNTLSPSSIGLFLEITTNLGLLLILYMKARNNYNMLKGSTGRPQKQNNVIKINELIVES